MAKNKKIIPNTPFLGRGDDVAVLAYYPKEDEYRIRSISRKSIHRASEFDPELTIEHDEERLCRDFDRCVEIIKERMKESNTPHIKEIGKALIKDLESKVKYQSEW